MNIRGLSLCYMNNILLRAITGFFFISIIIGALWFGGLTTSLVMTLFAILGLNEFYTLFNKNKVIQLNKSISLTTSISIYIIALLVISKQIQPAFINLIIPIIFIYFSTELYRKKVNPILNLSVFILSLFYIAVPFLFVTHLQFIEVENSHLAIGMFLLIWTNDTFAYLSGRFFGKTKLFERISPKKTWEGTVGGILFTLLVGYLIYLSNNIYPISFWLLSALIIAPCSIFGDLLESLFKRSLNIKDSGNILPGHGGILDRFDAAIFAIPFFYALVVFYS